MKTVILAVAMLVGGVANATGGSDIGSGSLTPLKTVTGLYKLVKNKQNRNCAPSMDLWDAKSAIKSGSLGKDCGAGLIMFASAVPVPSAVFCQPEQVTSLRDVRVDFSDDNYWNVKSARVNDKTFQMNVLFERNTHMDSPDTAGMFPDVVEEMTELRVIGGRAELKVSHLKKNGSVELDQKCTYKKTKELPTGNEDLDSEE